TPRTFTFRQPSRATAATWLKSGPDGADLGPWRTDEMAKGPGGGPNGGNRRGGDGPKGRPASGGRPRRTPLQALLYWGVVAGVWGLIAVIAFFAVFATN